MINDKDFVYCERGNAPIIFTVPHGGKKKFEDLLVERDSGIKGIDKNTISFALLLQKTISDFNLKKTETKCYPSIIYSDVHRSRIDFNRPPEDAYSAKCELCEKIYAQFHDNIENLIKHNIKRRNISYLFDIHGFEKSKRPPGFMDVEIVVGTQNLRSILPQNHSKEEKMDNIRNAIVKDLHENDILTAPIWPRQKEYVLTGGYIVQKYGIENLNYSKSLQIELSDDVRYKNKGLREKVIKTLSEVISNYCC
jgi:N-formylglutamate amidohydrolase